MKTTGHIRGRIDSVTPNPIDVYVGERIKLRRKLLGLSQSNCAKKLGLTFQQVQKYEKGINRISASRLWDISCALGVSMDYFFEHMDKQISDLSPAALNTGHPFDTKNKHMDPMSSNEILQLVMNYRRCKKFCPKIAASLFKLMSDAGKVGTFFPYADDEK